MARLEEQRITGPGEGRVLFVPAMEPYGARLLAAVFRWVGYDARVLDESDITLDLGLKHTGGGECVPCPSTLGSLLYAMQQNDLPPERVILFMPTACGPCRFGQYAKLDAMVFEKKGWDGIRIMSPSAENAYAGLDNSARKRLWHAIVVADVMRKLEQRVRPYEVDKGTVDAIMTRRMAKMEAAFAGPDMSAVETALAETVAEIGAVKRRNEVRPLVGVVGEIYVRCNPFINGNACRRIEALGGEAWLAPVSEWILYTNYLKDLIAQEQSRGLKAIFERVRNWLETHAFFEKVEHHYYRIADPVLHDRHEWPMAEVMEEGCKYLPWQFEGEAVLTLGRAALFVRKDGAKAILNASPMFCMPGTITSSIFPKLEQELGVPVICNFYDGSGDPNQNLVPTMHYLCEACRNAPVAG